MVTRRYVLGLDLGPAAAFTALAVVERTDPEERDADPTFAVRHLHRFPPGTAYGRIVEAVGDLLGKENLAGSLVVADLTAVGTGVLYLLREHESRPDVVPVVVTAGHHTERGPNGVWLVPKKDLVTGLQLLLQGRRLAIPTTLPDADLLARELGNFRAKATLAADPTQAEWREGRDDDLVLAVALGGWWAVGMSDPVRGPSIELIPRYSGYPREFCPVLETRPWWW
jgi:hypothetical protein